LDAPGVVWELLGGGVAAGVCGLLLHFWSVLTRFEWAPSHGITLLNAGAWCLLGGVLMVASSYYGKFRARDRLLACLQLRGTSRCSMSDAATVSCSWVPRNCFRRVMRRD